ncbi:RNA methyltransferase TrmH family, group 2 [Legionella moravica]|uniref:tRNA (cytidine(34)-2'-O)-methyltransferase n=1 Tax=Legionella moravica TaxID=39962 RepID=A0A378JW73_9GAMM|nr:tRNA (uridine(34)/cytosine(34)/5-carboxymethylaminomethyluridine(34)-2'-O)-methyltransferase TrmL [Legionella moravica]KTD37545.1 RNA methyltransferase TrmH family, group 2 [Legionella moravica]STX61608.1 RNA methyltransferase TrmH family, group 2 [Legionella moravica]
MLHIALYQPEIPPNTGNIIRLCANSGAQLHLIHPLGFELDDKRMRRAGLDYHEWASVQQYADWNDFQEQHKGRRIFCCTTKTDQSYSEVQYQPDDILLFGPETRGLPAEIRTQYASIRIPMVENSRSLNLSNAVAIILFEAWRQLKFA